MVPDNNDQGFSSDDEEDIAWQQRLVGPEINLQNVKISRNLISESPFIRPV